MNLTKSMDMAAVVHAMSQPDSGLEVRDRMWLKITIPHAFIGTYIQECCMVLFIPFCKIWKDNFCASTPGCVEESLCFSPICDCL